MDNNILKVLFITHVTNMAGANRSMWQLVYELKENYQVSPVVLGPNDNTTDGIKSHLAQIGVEYIDGPISFFKIPNPGIKDFARYIKYLIKNFWFYKKLKSYHFDIIHSNSSVIDFGGYLRLLLRCKHVWHFREFGDLDYNLHPIGGKMYEKFTYKHTDAIIAISEIIARHYSAKVDEKKIHVIYNGVLDVENKYQSIHGSKQVQFFCAGILSDSKNQKEIVRAVDVLVNQYHKSGFNVTFVGRHLEPYTTELRQMINKKNLNAYISILPESDGIKEITKNMDVGIVPSHAEAFGRVTIEYQLQNLLVIGNDQGANPELIQNGKTGLIYKQADYNKLANMMQDVIENDMDWKGIAKAGMLNAKKHFLSSYNTDAIYKLYQEIL